MKEIIHVRSRMLLLLAFVAMLATACQSEKKDGLTFNAETPLSVFKPENGRLIDIGDALLGSPLSLMYHPKGYLVCTDNQSELMVKIIDLKTGKMQELVRKGRGPHECLHVSTLSIVGNDIWAFGPQIKKMIQLRPDSVGHFSVVSETIIADQAFQCVALSNDLFAGASFTKARISYYSNQGVLLYSTTTMPNEADVSENGALSNVVFQTDLAASADGKKVLVANKFIDIIECYSDKGDSLFYITGPDGFRPELRKAGSGGVSSFPLFPLCFAYTNIRTVGEEVWASYIGLMHDGQSQLNPTNMIPNQIYCFTSEGVPIRKLELDKKFVSFAVNPDKTKLYCLVHNPDVEIIEYDLSGILD